jgi:hypothetical protein
MAAACVLIEPSSGATPADGDPPGVPAPPVAGAAAWERLTDGALEAGVVGVAVEGVALEDAAADDVDVDEPAGEGAAVENAADGPTGVDTAVGARGPADRAARSSGSPSPSLARWTGLTGVAPMLPTVLATVGVLPRVPATLAGSGRLSVRATVELDAGARAGVGAGAALAELSR